MRPTYTLADLFETPSRARVLRVLARSRVPLSARAVGRAAGISHTAAGATLRDLDAMGLLSSATIGRAIAYELRFSNAYIRHMVLPAIEAERVIVSELRADLVSALAQGSESLILFGSYATGDQSETSDIDVFALVADARHKQDLEGRAAHAFGHFSATYGSPLSLLVYTRAEARAHLLPGQNPFRTELESSGIILHGLGVGEWGIDGSPDENARSTERPRAPASGQG